jgi:hypothetical protein
VAAADADLDAGVVVGVAGQPEPQHVHRGAELAWTQAEFTADDRVPPVGGDGERRADLDPLAVGPDGDHAPDRAVLPDQFDDLVPT